MPQRKNWNREALEQVVRQCLCVSDVCRALGISVSTSNFRTFEKYRKLWNLDTSHFNVKAKMLSGVKRYNKGKQVTNDELFTSGSSISPGVVRRRVLAEGLIPYACKKCSNEGVWLGEPLTLQLDHVNGVHNDHRLSNLRFLCPNCHDQTDTHGSKNLLARC